MKANTPIVFFYFFFHLFFWYISRCSTLELGNVCSYKQAVNMSILNANLFSYSNQCRSERWKWEVVDPNGKRIKIRIRVHVCRNTVRSSKLNLSRAVFNPGLYREIRWQDTLIYYIVWTIYQCIYICGEPIKREIAVSSIKLKITHTSCVSSSWRHIFTRFTSLDL